MASLAEFFEYLRDQKRRFLNADTGADFERRIYTEMDQRVGLSRIQNDQIPRDTFTEIKRRVQLKTSVGGKRNTTAFRKHFLFQPYGSQDYPDLLVLNGDVLHAIEIKFSRGRQGRPMWNSGAPRPSGIYVFGAYERGDLTFFMGGSVLSPEDAKAMHDEWDKVQSDVQDFNSLQMSEQTYGFHLYARKAFDQNKSTNPDAITDFFANPNRKQLEDEVVDYLQSLDS